LRFHGKQAIPREQSFVFACLPARKGLWGEDIRARWKFLGLSIQQNITSEFTEPAKPIRGDFNYLFLELLPRLKPGVIVHVHDIFFPFDYPRDWVMDELRFWSEQYLLQAFLSFNSEFEVLIANHYLAHYYLADFKQTFPHSPSWSGGSFWMRRNALVN